MTVGEIGQLLTGIAALWAAISSARNGRKIDVIHKATNSLVDRLVHSTKEAAFAAGQKDEKEKT